QRYINQPQKQSDHQLYLDHFTPNAIYPDEKIEQHFWISKPLFVKIEADLQWHDAYWVQRK
ncbi:hypothetical protein CROQUDRAFT_17905, partial [Cronartium quercuum f. sp. fusiforme G11]